MRHPNRHRPVKLNDGSGMRVADERHMQPESQPKRGPTRRASKRKYCGGKVGREHTPEPLWKVDWHKRWEYVCSNCGKILDTWYPPTPYWSRPKPEWVPDDAA